MKILIVDAYFYPELTSFSPLEEDLLNGFINAGHSVTVVCSTPTRGVDDETARKYKKIKNETLYGGKVSVKRFWAPRELSNPILRALRYWFCDLMAYRTAKKLSDVDLIFTDSTPPTQGKMCAKIAKKLGKKLKKRIPFVYDLQDIFPESLVGAGLTCKGSLLWKLGRRIEDKTYNGADKIIVISEDFKRNIMAKGVPEEKIEIVYNWINTDKVYPVERAKNRLFDEYGVSRDDFVVVYAGNFGVSQGINVVVDAALMLKDKKDIKFVMFGSGPEYEKIRNYAESLGLTNVIINPILPPERVPEVYSMGDIVLIVCKKGVGISAIPSKTFSIMACNTPIIASFDTDSELADMLTSANAGICVEPEDAQALADAISKVKLEKMTVNSREFVLKNANYKACVGKYIEIFENSKKLYVDKLLT